MPAAVAVLAVLAFVARGGGSAAAGAPPPEPGGPPSLDLGGLGTEVLGDAESCYRLRLIELTLASGRAPRRDRFLVPPAGRPVPWPPLYHGALARLARMRLARRSAGL